MHWLVIVNIVAALLHGALLIWLLRFAFSEKFSSGNTVKTLRTKYVKEDNICDRSWGRISLEEDGEFPTFLLIVVFTVVTFIAHVGYASANQKYLRMIETGSNRFRWLEYGVTASLIAAILANLAGVRESYLLLIITVATFSWMQHGASLETTVMNGTPLGFFNVGLPLIAGFSLLAAIFFVTIRTFFKYTDDFEKHVTDRRDSCDSQSVRNIPEALKQLIWLTLIFYGSFGVVALAYVLRAMNKGWQIAVKDFKSFEAAYIGLSLVSKVFLAVWAVGYTFGEDGSLEWLTPLPVGSTRDDRSFRD